METVNVFIKLPKVKGYNYTGEYRPPVDKETYLKDGLLTICSTKENKSFFILEKIKEKIPINPKDVDCSDFPFAAMLVDGYLVTVIGRRDSMWLCRNREKRTGYVEIDNIYHNV